MTVHFKITIVGSGNSIEECWEDAVNSLAEDPGPTPEESEYEIVEEDEEEEEL